MQPYGLRFGNDNALSVPAASFGSGQGNLGVRLALSHIADENRMSELQQQEASQQDMQANQLQTAYQMQQQRLQGSPTSQNYFRKSGSPMAQSIQSKKLTRAAILGDQSLNPEDQTTLDEAENNQFLDLPTFEKMTRAVQGRQTASQKLQQSTAKQTATQQARDAKQAQMEADKNANAQRAEITPQMKALQKEIEEAGGDVNGPPTQFNPTQTTTPGSMIGGFSDMMMQGITGGGAGDPTTSVQGGDPAMMQKFIQYQRLKQQLAGARPGTPAAAAGIPRVATADDYAAIPSGQNYLDPDGHLRKKP